MSRSIPGLPWLLVEAEADLGPIPPGLILSGATPTPIFGITLSQLSVNVAPESLPEALGSAIGKKLWAFSETGDKRCEVVITGFAARVLFEVDSNYSSEVFDPYVEDANEDGVPDTPVTPEAERFKKAFDEGEKRLVAVLTRDGLTPYGGCGDELDYFVSDSPMKRLPLVEEVPELLSQKAVEGFRAHAFWDLQQDAYQRSLEDERTRVRQDLEEAKMRREPREELEAIRDGDKSRDAPKTWDLGAQDWGGPSFRAFGEEGKPFFIEVELGNDLSCAAPRAWMIFRVVGSDLETVAFDVGRTPLSLVDLEEDGRYEMVRGGWLDKRIESLGLEALPVRSLSYLKPHEYHCGYDSLGPPSAP